MATPRKPKPHLPNRRPFSYTPEQLDRVRLVASQGMLERDIAALLGIGASTLTEMKKRHPELREAISGGTAEGIERAIKALDFLIEQKNTSALIFYLKCKGGFREDGIHNPQPVVAGSDSESISDRILASVQRISGAKPRRSKDSSD